MASGAPEVPAALRQAQGGPRFPLLCVALGAACALAFAACHLFGNGVDEATLVACGAKDRDLILRARQWWRLVSAGFLHADGLHLAVNLYALLSLGRIVEALWGRRRFLILYTAALVGGSAASLAGTPGTAVGASGAVFGLLGALVAFATIHRRLLAPRARRPLLLNLAVVLVVNLALGLSVPFIDNAAHLGGLAAGAVAAVVLRPIGALGRGSPLGEALAWIAAAAACVGIGGSLALAARNARASRWMLALGGEMETRRLDGGQLTLRIPRGWSHRPPEGPNSPHAFLGRDSLAVVAVRLLPDRKGLDPPTAASGIQAAWAKEGLKVVATRETLVGEQPGVEVLARRDGRGAPERHRAIVFQAPNGRLVYASFVCLEERQKALEVLFDRVLHSIRVGPPQAEGLWRPQDGPSGEERVWEKVAEDPRDPDAAVGLAARYAREGRADQAERILLAVLRLHPSHAECHNQLALLYATARPPHRKPAEAVRRAQRALALQPDSPRYLATLALAHEAAGDRAKALDAARRAAALAPDDATYADLVKRLRE